MLGQMPLMMGQVHQVQTPLARRPITGGPQLSGYPGPGPAQLPGYRPQPGPFPTSPGAGPQHAPQYRQVAIYLFIYDIYYSSFQYLYFLYIYLSKNNTYLRARPSIAEGGAARAGPARVPPAAPRPCP